MALWVSVEIGEERAEEAEDEGDQRQREQRVEVGTTETESGEQPRRG